MTDQLTNSRLSKKLHELGCVPFEFEDGRGFYYPVAGKAYFSVKVGVLDIPAYLFQDIIREENRRKIFYREYDMTKKANEFVFTYQQGGDWQKELEEYLGIK